VRKLHEKSCYGCKYAIEARDHMRKGEQVRCKVAEELFGGTRWVNIRTGKNGDVLKSKCGEFEPFQGDETKTPDPKDETQVEIITDICDTCNGAGKLVLSFGTGQRKHMSCKKCDGKGVL
jgi:hypothetical protein